MGLRPTNSDENPAVGQALGLRRPLRPPGRAFNNLRWVFDRARIFQGPLRGYSLGYPLPNQSSCMFVAMFSTRTCWKPISRNARYAGRMFGHFTIGQQPQ